MLTGARHGPGLGGGDGAEETERRGSQLFTVRLWIEDMGEGDTEHRGQVRHVLSGATWHFRNWEDLRRWIVSALERYEAAAR